MTKLIAFNQIKKHEKVWFLINLKANFKLKRKPNQISLV